MSSSITRRQFLAGLSAVASSARATTLESVLRQPMTHFEPAFTLSVLTDEITQDFGRALEIAAKEFGLGQVELRELWGKNLMKLDAKEIGEAKRLLEQYKLRVSSIASPVFKVNWPGAPLSRYSPKGAEFGADFTFKQQDELLDHAIEIAHALKAEHIRIFDFWRLDEQASFRAAIDEKLIEAAAKAAKRNVTLLLENEHACNTATGAEAARTLGAVRSPNFKLNWDPGNAAARGETPFPDGYKLLPKDRIGYMHCKDISRKADGTTAWEAMGRGVIDYVGQFRALKKDGYRGTLSLETHWRGAATPEESTRQSMAGMKDLLRRAESR